MRRGIIGVSLFLTISFIPAYSATPPKAGSACSKLGTTKTHQGKNYTCVKSGKKLIWSKGVVVKKAAPSWPSTPTPTPTPTPSLSANSTNFLPWTEDVTSKIVSDAAQKSFSDWARVQTGQPKHLFFSESAIHPNRLKSLRTADDLGSKLFSPLLPERTVTVIGNSPSWVSSKLNDNGGNYGSCVGFSGNAGLNYCLDGGPSHGYVVTGDAVYDPRNPGNDGAALLAHEYFHLVQWGLSGTNKQPFVKGRSAETNSLFPAWFSEGTADFVGYSIAAMSQGALYWDGYEAMFRYAPQSPENNRNSLEDYELRTGQDNKTPTYPYTVGRIATEYLIASIGFENMLKIWIDFRTTRNFERSFEKNVGISKKEFYKRFEKVRTKLSLPEVSWKLRCVNGTISNVPISGLSTTEAASKLIPSNC